jgi:hypothetical protein
LLLTMLLAGLGLGIGASHHSAPDPQADTARSETLLATLAAGNRKRLELARFKLAEGAGRPSDQEGAEGHPGAAISAFLRSAKLLQESTRMLNRDEVQGTELASVAANPGTLALARQLATDAALAERLYGKDQAVARVAAVRTLTHLARNGRADLVGEAVNVLGKKLNASQEWSKGVEHDYTDLLTSHILAVGKAEILKNPEAFFSQIQLSPRTRAEVGRAFFSSGFQASVTADEMARLREVYRRYVPRSQTGG